MINTKELIPLTFDVMFTEIFNDELNICILEEFIAGYFNYPLEDVRGNLEILSRKLGKENRLDSRKEIDLLLNLHGKKINIEMSNSNSHGVLERNIVYLCKIHGGQLKTGDKFYSAIDESIQIIFNNFDCQEELKTTWYLRDETGKILSKKLRIDIINLAKGKVLCYTDEKEVNYLINWSKLLTESHEESIKNISHKILSHESTKKLVDKMNTLSGDDEMVRLYTKLNRRQMEYNTIEHEFDIRKQELDAQKQELDAKEHEINAKQKEINAKEHEINAKIAEAEEKIDNALKKGIEEGLEKGIEEGLEKGVKQTTINLAKKMLKKKTDIEYISEITNLSIDEINNLK